MVFLFGIDIPDIMLICFAFLNCLGSSYSGKHGVVHIIVTMLTVSAYTEEILVSVLGSPILRIGASRFS